MKLLDIALDLRTAQLVRVVKAFTQAESIETSTVRNLTGAVGAIRALAEAGEPKSCGELAERLGKIVADLEVEDPALDWSALIGKHCDRVVAAVTPGPKGRL